MWWYKIWSAAIWSKKRYQQYLVRLILKVWPKWNSRWERNNFRTLLLCMNGNHILTKHFLEQKALPTTWQLVRLILKVWPKWNSRWERNNFRTLLLCMNGNHILTKTFLEHVMVQNMISTYLEHTLRSHHHSVEVYDGGLAKNDKIPFKHN